MGIYCSSNFFPCWVHPIVDLQVCLIFKLQNRSCSVRVTYTQNLGLSHNRGLNWHLIEENHETFILDQVFKNRDIVLGAIIAKGDNVSQNNIDALIILVEESLV